MMAMVVFIVSGLSWNKGLILHYSNVAAGWLQRALPLCVKRAVSRHVIWHPPLRPQHVTLRHLFPLPDEDHRVANPPGRGWPNPPPQLVLCRIRDQSNENTQGLNIRHSGYCYGTNLRFNGGLLLFICIYLILVHFYLWFILKCCIVNAELLYYCFFSDNCGKGISY